ncbi:MAG: aldehyde dehydrogenase family protein, partial [Candidatus Eiseniibacteriota bacterium]
MNDVAMWIDHQPRGARGGETMPVENPATEEILAQVPRAQEADVAAAVEGACFAQRGWRRLPGLEKARLLHEVA